MYGNYEWQDYSELMMRSLSLCVIAYITAEPLL